MKQISARQFRTSFADLTEPVTVIRRRTDGGFDALGAWSPNGEDPILAALTSEQRTIVIDLLRKRQQTPSQWLSDVVMDMGLGRASGREYPAPTTMAPGFGHPVAAPKPARKGKS